MDTIPLTATHDCPAIDPRSFHVFEFRDEKLLYDRATGAVCEVDDVTYELLRLIESSVTLPDALARVVSQFEGVDAQVCTKVLADVRQRGFFRYLPVRDPISEKDLNELWRHKPRRIQLMMAESCNLACGYCYAWRNEANNKETLMSWPVARTAVDYLVWRSGGRKDLQVTFFGGEPLLNYRTLQQVVEYCKAIEERTDKRFLFELITNGTLLSKEVVDYLVEHRFLLFISVDGWREMHNYSRPALGGQDLHETIVRNAVYADEQYKKHQLVPIKVRANLTDRYHDIGKVAEYLESFGFLNIGIGPIDPLPHGDGCPMALNEDQMDELMEARTDLMLDGLEKLRNGESVGRFRSKLFNRAFREMQPRSWLGIICGVCRNTAIVDNKGNLYPCHRYDGMEAYKVGNVFTGVDRELTTSYYLKINGRAIADCNECWIRDSCAGGCPWLYSDKAGEIHSPTERSCARRRTSAERGLWFRKELRASFPERFKDGKEASLEDWNWNIGDDSVSDHCSC